MLSLRCAWNIVKSQNCAYFTSVPFSGLSLPSASPSPSPPSPPATRSPSPAASGNGGKDLCCPYCSSSENDEPSQQEARHTHKQKAREEKCQGKRRADPDEDATLEEQEREK